MWGPKGSILGPLLFSLYVNDLKNASVVLDPVMFADGTNLFYTHSHIAELSKSLDLFTAKYERLFFLGDFNAEMEDSSIKTFCSNFNLTSMINKPTCYKNPDKPTCIDLILTNCSGSFQNSCVIGTGLSDFHKMIVTVMKACYRKIEARVMN